MTELDLALLMALGLSLAGNLAQWLAAERRARRQERAFEEIKAYTLKTAGELAERSSRFFGFRPGDVAALMAGHIVLRDDLALGEAVNYQRLQLVLIGGGV